jgi:hypothetical protein
MAVRLAFGLVAAVVCIALMNLLPLRLLLPCTVLVAAAIAIAHTFTADLVPSRFASKTDAQLFSSSRFCSLAPAGSSCRLPD